MKMPNKHFKCQDCGTEISKMSYDHTVKRYGIPLCWKCTRTRNAVPEEELGMI